MKNEVPRRILYKFCDLSLSLSVPVSLSFFLSLFLCLGCLLPSKIFSFLSVHFFSLSPSLLSMSSCPLKISLCYLAFCLCPSSLFLSDSLSPSLSLSFSEPRTPDRSRGCSLKAHSHQPRIGICPELSGWIDTNFHGNLFAQFGMNCHSRIGLSSKAGTRRLCTQASHAVTRTANRPSDYTNLTTVCSHTHDTPAMWLP